MSGCVMKEIVLLALFAVDTAQASSWTQLTPSGTTPSSRHAFGMVWSQGDDSMYVFGGRENDGVGRLNDLYRYSSSANNWTLLSPGGSPPTGRSSFGIASDDANDLFYVFGGEGVTVGSDLHQYNIAGNSWTQRISSGSAPSIRRGHGMVWSRSDDSIYIFGGYYSSSWTLMNDLYRYDNSASHWTTLSPGGSLPTGRGFAAMASCNSSLYVFGGHGSSIPLSDFYRYDILANDWTELSPTGSQPSRRYGHSMACREMDISLYVFGGHDGGPQEMLNDFYRYDVVANEWTMLSAAGSVPSARFYHSMAFSHTADAIYVFGGQFGGPNDLYRYGELQTTATTTTITMTTATASSATSTSISHSKTTTTTTTITTTSASASSIDTSTSTSRSKTITTSSTFSSTASTSGLSLHIQEEATPQDDSLLIVAVLAGALGGLCCCAGLIYVVVRHKARFRPDPPVWANILATPEPPEATLWEEELKNEVAETAMEEVCLDPVPQVSASYFATPEARAEQAAASDAVCHLGLMATTLEVTEREGVAETEMEEAPQARTTDWLWWCCAAIEPNPKGPARLELQKQESGKADANAAEEDFPDGKDAVVGMFSARFDGGEMEQKFRSVHAILKEHNFPVRMVAAKGGDDFGKLTQEYLSEIRLSGGVLICVCTKHYAEKTSSPFSSFEELKFARDFRLDVLPLKVADDYPPRPPSGPDHPYDKLGEAHSMIDWVFRPNVAYTDCRSFDEMQIARVIAERLLKKTKGSGHG